MKQPIRYDRKQESGIRHILKKIFAIREIVILLLVLVLGVFMALNSRQFLTTANFKTIGNYMANDMIIGAFLTISLIAGNTDFSVGSNMGCSAFVCGLLLNAGLPVWVCILVGLCVGVAIGALNAFCIVQLKVVPMIATMGTWMAFKGAGLMIINSSTLSFCRVYSSRRAYRYSSQCIYSSGIQKKPCTQACKAFLSSYSKSNISLRFHR